MSVLNLLDGVITQVGEDIRAKQNRDFQADEAQKNREFQREMYDRQLDDNIAWRQHQEQYNSPEAQMSRYRDAGINPMYAVTGSGQNTVTSPMSMSGGFGSSPSGGSKASTIDSVARRTMENNRKVQENQMQNNTLVSEAQAQALEAQANESNARAEGLRYENSGKRLDSLINDELQHLKVYSPLGDDMEGASYARWKAETIAQATAFRNTFDQMDFESARKKFFELPSVIEFERDLREHKRSMFEHELSQAKSAADIFAVSARWALANQWINAGTEIVGAAGSLLGTFKGTSMMPTVSRSYSESYGDHTTRTIHY